MLQRFNEHPATVGESYQAHRRAAFGYSSRLFRAAFCCAIHGLFPWLHTHSGSEAVKSLHSELMARQQCAANGAAKPPATNPNPELAARQHAA